MGLANWDALTYDLTMNVKRVVDEKLYVKVGEHEDRESCYVCFDEEVNIPALGSVFVSLEFERSNSFVEVKQVVDLLRSRGVRLVIQK